MALQGCIRIYVRGDKCDNYQVKVGARTIVKFNGFVQDFSLARNNIVFKARGSMGMLPHEN